jgi:hypothetical protein
VSVQVIGIHQVKAAHRGQWFDRAPTAEFRKSLPRIAYRGPGGTYFIKSELDGANERRYTICCQRHGGDISTASEWMEYRTQSGACRAAKKLAARGMR